MNHTLSPFRKLLFSVVLPLCIVVVWEILARKGFFRPQVLPAPSQVFSRWVDYLIPHDAYDGNKMSFLTWLVSGELVQDAFASGFRVIAGFVIAAVLALALGLLMGFSKFVYDLLNPLVQLLRPIPPIAYIPLAILWFGLGNPPAFFLISIGAFFPILMNTIAGVRQVDPLLIRAAKNLGASDFTLFRRVILPAATPSILVGLRVGIGVAFIVVIVAEMIAVNNGLGYRILEAREFLWSDKIIAGMISIGLLGLAIDVGMSKINNHLLRWHSGNN
ncbi:MAG: ABC transporter permease [Desulfomonilaceae bacterium]